MPSPSGCPEHCLFVPVDLPTGDSLGSHLAAHLPSRRGEWNLWIPPQLICERKKRNTSSANLQTKGQVYRSKSSSTYCSSMANLAIPPILISRLSGSVLLCSLLAWYYIFFKLTTFWGSSYIAISHWLLARKRRNFRGKPPEVPYSIIWLCFKWGWIG